MKLYFLFLNGYPLFQKRLVDLLLVRRESKPVLLTVCKQMITPGQQATLSTISKVFDQLNKVYFAFLDAESQAVVNRFFPVVDNYRFSTNG